MLSQVGNTTVSISKNDTITKIQPLAAANDSIINDTIPKERLEDTVDYNSYEQYHDAKGKHTYLVTDAIVKYLDMEIKADYIDINWESGDVYAVGKEDSTGKIIEPSIFKQGNKEIEYNSFSFNIKTKQGRAYNVRTEEGVGSEKGVVVAGVVKQYNDTISGMRKIAYTTDTYFIEKKDSLADYHLEAEVAKYEQGKSKKIITGPISMKIYGVSTPLVLPFSFLPMGSKRSAGILLPSFGERENVGFYLQGMGFYLPIGDYIDLTLTGDVYTRGSLGLHATSTYLKKYRYTGGFNFDWEKRVNGIKGLDSYTKASNYNLRWTHRQDAKADPNLIFAANVNFRSSKFYRQGVGNNGISSGNYLQNNVNSSISLSKTFPNSPFSASLVISHNQNTNSNSEDVGKMTFQLPQFTLNMNRVFPFAPKSGAKKGLLQSIGLTYGFNLQNTVYTDEDNLFTDKMFDDAKNGAQHRININTGTTLFNYFPLSFNAGYEEVWTLKTTNKYYDVTTDNIIEQEVKGFDAYRQFNIGTSIQTTLYGTKIFGNADDNKMIKAIRHMISPNIGFSYRPDFSTDNWGYYGSYLDGNREEVKYSYFENGIYGSPGRGLSQSLTFGINNNVEMKVRNRTDSTGVQKIKLLESLNISGSYNFAADSMKLSPISVSGRTSLLKNKVGINFGGTVDFYKIKNGKIVDEMGGLRFSTMRVGLTYDLTQAIFGEREMDYDRRGRIRYEDYYFDDLNYAQFLTPWSLAVNMNYNRKVNVVGDVDTTTTIGLRGSFSPSPHWAITGRTSYDFKTGDFAGTYLTFSRDLRSFVIDFSMNPFGQYKTWNFFIGIKASFLRDAVKYEEQEFRGLNSNF